MPSARRLRPARRSVLFGSWSILSARSDRANRSPRTYRSYRFFSFLCANLLTFSNVRVIFRLEYPCSTAVSTGIRSQEHPSSGSTPGRMLCFFPSFLDAFDVPDVRLPTVDDFEPQLSVRVPHASDIRLFSGRCVADANGNSTFIISTFFFDRRQRIPDRRPESVRNDLIQIIKRGTKKTTLFVVFILKPCCPEGTTPSDGIYSWKRSATG